MAGSQLIARFDSDEDPQAALALVRDVVMDSLGSESAVGLEAARGCTAIYITFFEKNLSIESIVIGLMLKGAQLSYINDPERQAGFMTPVVEGIPAECASTEIVFTKCCSLMTMHKHTSCLIMKKSCTNA